MSESFKLVLDLDQTLVDTRDIQEDINGDNYDGMFDISGTNLRTYIRPFMSEFLSYAEQYFDEIHVFSAGTEDYVRQVVAKLFRPDLQNKILSRAHCVISETDGRTTKQLDIHELDTIRTFMIDDRSDVHSANFHVNPTWGNFYQISPYNVSSTEPDKHLLSAIAEIKKWLTSFNFRV
jgi:hypothetical protein